MSTYVLQAFCRIICNGRGEIAGTEWPYKGDIKALTHAFVDSTSQLVASDLLAEGVHVCERNFIGKTHEKNLDFPTNILF